MLKIKFNYFDESPMNFVNGISYVCLFNEIYALAYIVWIKINDSEFNQ